MEQTPAVVLQYDDALTAGLLLIGCFFGVICLLFGVVMGSWIMAAFSLLFLLPALSAALWFSKWRVSFFDDRVEARTLFGATTEFYRGAEAVIRRRPGPRFVRSGVSPMAPFLVLRRDGKVVLTVSESQAGERRAELLEFLQTLDIPRKYLS